jgi:predicted TIM-barrel fold metal-dependent hydrolase
MIFNVHSHLSRSKDSGELVVSGMPVPKYVKHCQALDVRRVCLCAGSGIWAEDYNELVRAAVKEYPDFFIGLAYIQLGKDDPHDVARWRDRGFRGLKMIDPQYPYDDPRAYEYYRRAERLNMPILFHTGWVAYNDSERLEYVNCGFMRPLCLDTICRNFPKLNVIGAHLGNFWWEEAVYLAPQFENLCFDLSGGSIRMKSLRFFRDAFSKGAKPNLESTEEIIDYRPFEHFVYGSDNPPPEVLLSFYNNLMRLLEVPEPIRQKVLWGNAAKMFQIEA